MTTNETRAEGASESADAGDELGALSARVHEDPSDDAAWDRLEDIAADGNRPDGVSSIYRDVLAGSLSPALAATLGQRAFQFHEEWYGEDAPELAEVLRRIIELDPGSGGWAFQRLTMAYTNTERWDDLLSLYDRAIDAQKDPRRLLEEAASLAKDVAGQPDKAIGYLERLLSLKPGDEKLAASLERLLERQGSWNELIAFWESRMGGLSAEEAAATRVRVAELYLDRLDRPGEALTRVKAVLDEGGDPATACALLERIVARPDSSDRVRREAVAMLRSQYDREERLTDVVRALGTAIRFAQPGEKVELHKEAAERLAADGRDAEAMDHYAAVVHLEPTSSDVLDRLREIADRTGEQQRLVDVLDAAAEACADLSARVGLWSESADVRARALEDTAGAIHLYDRILRSEGVSRSIALRAARRLAELYGEAGRQPERLGMLERVADLEDGMGRRTALGAAARLADELGEIDRALGCWGARLEADGSDAEALEASIDLYERAERWDELVASLESRASLSGTPVSQRRADLVRVATIRAERLNATDDAIETWQAVSNEFGEDAAVVQALVALYTAAGRTEDRVSLLERSSARETAHLASVMASLGDAYRDALGEPLKAARAYARAVRFDPTLERARAGLASLTDHEAARPIAVAALQEAFEATDDWQSRIELLPLRLQVTEHPALRSRILQEVAELQEQRAEDPAAALESVRRALVSTPRDRFLEAELLRLAEASGGHESAAAGFAEAAAAAAGDDARVAQLRVLEASAHERLSASAAAAAAFAAALAVDAGRVDAAAGVVRAAADSGRWPVAAEAIASAIERQGPSRRLLALMAEVQRQQPSRALVDTLVALYETDRDDLDAAVEAAEVALDAEVDDPELAATVLDALYSDGSRLWRRGAPARGERAPEACARWACERLLSLLGDAGAHRRAVEIHLDAARPPWPPEEARVHRRAAADLAAGPLGDPALAMSLYRDVLVEAPDDRAALAALSRLYEAGERYAELVTLRERALAAAQAPEDRLSLRLDIARTMGALEARSGRVKVLRENLAEVPGDAATLDALWEVLVADGRYGDLVDVWAGQAAALEPDAPSRAARLWSTVAQVAEEHLHDVDRAGAAHRKVVELDATPESLTALARIHTEAGEHADAARWLERKLAMAGDDASTELYLQLARAHLGAGDGPAAVPVLERAWQSAPGHEDVRELLRAQYAAQEAWEPLAGLLTQACDHVSDESTLLAMIHEAAGHYRRLGTQERSISVLQKGVRLAPDDRGLKHMLAESLRASGRLDEARDMLQELVETFGRRRSAERGAVHGELARVAYATGDLAGALEQLALATKMDMDNAELLKMQGSLAREAGELDAAERAYRTLLLVARRHADAGVGAGEVLFELHTIARDKKDQEQADDLLESALEAATQSDSEALKLGEALLGRGEAALARQVLERRLDSVKSAAGRAPLLIQLAAVLEGPLADVAGALERRLEALRLRPADAELHAATRSLASDQGLTARYVEVLTDLVDQHRREEDAQLAAQLMMRLGQMHETELQDLDSAAELYRRVEETGSRTVPALEAQLRIATTQDDTGEELRVVQALLDAGALSGEARIDALYRVAELSLGDAGHVDGGVAAITAAYAAEPRVELAARLLAVAADASPAHLGVLDVYERVARDSDDGATLLDHAARRARHPSATVDQVQEAVERAAEAGDDAVVVELLARAVEVAEAAEEGLRAAQWAILSLADRAEATGDTAALIGWLQRAVEVAEEHERRDLELRLGRAATSDGGDLDLAASIFERLYEDDPTDEGVWSGLLSIHRRRKDEAALDALASSLLDALLEPALRNRVRMERVPLLLEDPARQYEAVDALKAVLDEDPDHAEAARLLTGLYEKSGYDEDLVDLLQRQLDVARDNEDLPTISEVGLKLGAVLEKVRRDDAIDVYRQVLEWVPRDRPVVESLLRLLGDEGDPRDRAEVRERLLGTERGASASSLARELYGDWEALEDEDGMQRALELGYAGNPDDDEIRGMLEGWYRQRDAWEPLARFLAAEAARIGEGADAVARLREAAGIQREHLGDMEAAIAVLRAARASAPSDLDLLEELVSSQRDAGKHDLAVEDVGASLDLHAEANATRTRLLRMRADLRLHLGDEAAAVEDLEEAYAEGGAGVAPDLIDALGRQRDTAARAGDRDAERVAVFRLAEVLGGLGEHDRVREVLASWVQVVTDDHEALIRLRDMDLSAEHWDGVVDTCQKLIRIQTGDAQVEAVMMLADACEAAARLPDARAGLEAVHAAQPDDVRVAERVRMLYEQIGAHRELAALLLGEAEGADEERKFELLRRAGKLLIESVGDADAALEALERAARMRPGDHRTAVLLADAYTNAQRFADAGQLLEAAIANHPKRRSPELSQLQHRMAKLAAAAGDQQLQLQWLNAALDSDKNNGDVAAELAQLAMAMGEYDLALNALRAVTLMKAEGPMSRAEAFLYQAKIAHQRGELRRAVLWARKAKSEDPSLAEADQFLETLGEG